MLSRSQPFKYPKPKRLPIGKNLKNKDIMSKKDMEYLLRGKVVVEEKMDGSPLSFSAQDPNLLIFTEDLKKKHSIFYHIPGRYAIFDIFDLTRDVFLFPDEKLELSKDIRAGKIKIQDHDGILFFPVPRLAIGQFSLEELGQFVGLTAYARDKSSMDTEVPGEGIVVKQFSDCFLEEFVSGKIVRNEFADGITIHHLRLPYETNAIDSSLPLITELRQL